MTTTLALKHVYEMGKYCILNVTGQEQTAYLCPCVRQIKLELLVLEHMIYTCVPCVSYTPLHNRFVKPAVGIQPVIQPAASCKCSSIITFDFI